MHASQRVDALRQDGIPETEDLFPGAAEEVCLVQFEALLDMLPSARTWHGAESTAAGSVYLLGRCWPSRTGRQDPRCNDATISNGSFKLAILQKLRVARLH